MNDVAITTRLVKQGQLEPARFSNASTASINSEPSTNPNLVRESPLLSAKFSNNQAPTFSTRDEIREKILTRVDLKPGDENNLELLKKKEKQLRNTGSEDAKTIIKSFIRECEPLEQPKNFLGVVKDKLFPDKRRWDKISQQREEQYLRRQLIRDEEKVEVLKSIGLKSGDDKKIDILRKKERELKDDPTSSSGELRAIRFFIFSRGLFDLPEEQKEIPLKRITSPNLSEPKSEVETSWQKWKKDLETFFKRFNKEQFLN